MWTNIGSKKIWGNIDQKLLGVKLNRNLKFIHYILKQRKKAGRKLIELSRIWKFMSLECGRVLIKFFIKSHLAYCPLVLMCCNKTPDNGTNHLHLGRFGMTMYQHLIKF